MDWFELFYSWSVRDSGFAGSFVLESSQVTERRGSSFVRRGKLDPVRKKIPVEIFFELIEGVRSVICAVFVDIDIHRESGWLLF